MAGPIPKPATMRQRRNKSATSATLPAEVSRKRVPSLPKRADQRWHKLTRSWWKDIWVSPMASEFLQSDIHGLYILADLVDQYWNRPSKDLAAEIRLQRQCFGLTPIDRRRLQWEVERGEKAEERRRPPKPPEEAKPADPRENLRLVQ